MTKCGYCEDYLAQEIYLGQIVYYTGSDYESKTVPDGNITIPLNRLKLCEFCKHLRHSGRVMYGMIDDKNCKCEESK
mgnify:CR=1 FL=1